MNVKKIFVTGGAGFIGSHICENLFVEFKNSKIIILDIPQSTNQILFVVVFVGEYMVYRPVTQVFLIRALCGDYNRHLSMLISQILSDQQNFQI